MAKMLDIQVSLPDETSDEAVRLAQEKGKEAIILMLQQQGEMTIGEAAKELGLTYAGYLDLLQERGLPASYDGTSPSVLDLLRQGIDRP